PTITHMERGEVETLFFSEEHRNILSEREKELLRCITKGLSSKEIAAALYISVNTVNRHRQNILEKLSVGNSIEACRAAELMKLLDL
ncbi:response regulator transcription factor, partial [Phocaeicola vulgatus]